MVYNKPKLMVTVGVIFSFLVGMGPPMFGLIMSKLLAYLTAPWEFLAIMDKNWTGTGEDYLK